MWPRQGNKVQDEVVVCYIRLKAASSQVWRQVNSMQSMFDEILR